MNRRKLRSLIGLCVFLLFSVATWAQDRTITGRVTDAGGNGISGVSVTVKGQARGTTTKEDGTYTLNVPTGARTLVFSSVGYNAQEVAVSDNGNISVSLQSAPNNLNEVVVIGYGTARKKDLTGSVATITAKDFQKGALTTPDQLISGKVAGVAVTSNGGRPGAGSTIRIRGGSSLNASNDPLIVVDGIPLDNGTIAGAANPLSFINPNDIESFSVLKDASAAAIYGSRAANGVIIITTRKGRTGGLRVNFTSNNGISTIAKKVDVLTGDQIRAIVAAQGNALQKRQVGTASTDWQDVIYQNALFSDNNISLTGGVKWLPYRLTLGYLNQSGVLKTDRLQRTSVALALNPTFFDNHLKVDVNLKGSIQKTRFANEGAIGTAIGFDPTQPVYNNDKRYGGYFEWREADGSLVLNRANNPLGLLEQTFDNQTPKRSIGNIQFDYKFHFLPELRANLNLGYDVSKNEGTRFIPDSAASNYLSRGLTQRGKQTKRNTVLDFYLNYTKDVSSIKSRIDFTAGYSYNDFLTKNYNFRALNAKGDTIANTFAPQFAFDPPQYTLISFFGRLNYTLNDRYLLTATVRRDGSSRFSKANRWGTFPSLALAWNIKKESFLSNSRTFNDLKLRLGWGITGQQDGIGLYDYIARYGLGGFSAQYPFGNVYNQTYGAFGYNENLKWEQTKTYNAGLDFAFAGGRLNGSVDVYLKQTSDLLNSVPQPTGTNFSAFVLANVGSMENKGVEANLNIQAVKAKDFTLDFNVNATYNQNTITNLTVVPQDPKYVGLPTGSGDGVNGFLQLHAVGGPRSTFYLYRQVYDANGKPIEGLFEDANRDGIINDKDKYKGYSADPNFFMGFSTNATYRKWSGGFVMRANFNNYVYNNIFSNRGRLNQVLGNYTLGNASTNYLETNFRGDGDIQTLSDFYVENASFLRMDNLYVGYNFGRVARSKATLRLNAIVNNVFVVTKYSGLDPEVSGGIDRNLYPRPRTYSLGINLDF
jgi:TonB-dependent starch-binding outer membrane protein SusC